MKDKENGTEKNSKKEREAITNRKVRIVFTKMQTPNANFKPKI